MDHEFQKHIPVQFYLDLGRDIAHVSGMVGDGDYCLVMFYHGDKSLVECYFEEMDGKMLSGETLSRMSCVPAFVGSVCGSDILHFFVETATHNT